MGSEMRIKLLERKNPPKLGTRGLKGASLTIVIVVALFVPAMSLLQASFTSATPGGLVPHAPIYIDGGSAFTSANGVTGGSGTQSDPYIIEGWAINSSGANGIDIQNTTAYFIVRNCLLENGGTDYEGIYLYNVINGRIESNTIRNSCDGICLDSSSHNSIVNNISLINPYHAILLESSSDYNIVTGNTCNNNLGEGGSCGEGIYLDSSSYDNVTNNTCCGNHNGMEVVNSSNYNTFYNNNCSNNNDEGIELETYSSYNVLTNNTCSNNTYQGIGLTSPSAGTVKCRYNNLENNICDNNSEGIEIDNSDNNTLTSNLCRNCTTNGIYLSYNSSYNSAINNTCSNSTSNDIAIDSGSNYNVFDMWFSTGANRGAGNTLIKPPNTPDNLQPTTQQSSPSVTIFVHDNDNYFSYISGITVYFYDNSNGSLIGTLYTLGNTGGTASTTWNGLTTGTYTFYANAKDNYGALSRNSSKVSFQNTIGSNVPPNKPTSLSPSARQITTNVNISCVVTDNNGDMINVFFYDNSTKNIIDNVWISSGGTAQRTWSGLTRGQTYTFFARGQDNNGAWGDNSDTQSFKVNSLPTTTNLQTGGQTNPTHLTTFTPKFSWSYSDADSDTQTKYEIWVGTTSGSSDMWNSGQVSSSSTSATYGGSALSGGITYYVQVRIYDGYEWSSWATGTFRINQLLILAHAKINLKVPFYR